MPWYSAPARFAAATYRRCSSGNRCQPIAGEQCWPPSPAGNRRAPSCVSRVVTRKLARRRPPASPGAAGPRLVPCCRQGSWPPAGSASARARAANRGDLRARHLHPAPCPNRPRSPASGAERFSGPAAATPSAVLQPPAHGRAACRRRHLSAGTFRSHLVQPAECGCDLAVSIGSADRPGAQNCRSRATWTAQPTDRTWRQIRRVRARSRIGIRCAQPRPVTGRKLRAVGQTMDAAHASVVPSRARCSLGSVSARVEIHGLDRPRARRRSAGAAKVLIFTTPARQGPASASFQSLMNPLATTPCTTNGSFFGELLSGAADVTANDKGFLAPLWRSPAGGTSACDRALRERCISYLGRAPDFERGTWRGRHDYISRHCHRSV